VLARRIVTASRRLDASLIAYTHRIPLRRRTRAFAQQDGHHQPAGATFRLDSPGEASARASGGYTVQTREPDRFFPGVALNAFGRDLDPVHRRAGAEVRLAAVVQDVHVRLGLLPLEPPALR
jgi:hypothetical protein